MRTLLLILFIFSVSLYSCKDSSVNGNINNPPAPTGYKKILDAVSGTTKFEVYGNGYEKFYYGYNDIGIRVFLNNEEKKSGFVKFSPKFYDEAVPGVMKSSPVTSSFSYDNDKGIFTGYVNFLYTTQGNANWYGFFNYDDQNYVDSALLNVQPSSEAQVLQFQNSSDKYYITLIAPYDPKLYLNDFKCMLHQTTDDIAFTQVETANMYIRPWMITMNHGSSNNVDPVHIGNGIYSGKINLGMYGSWVVYDSIKINGNFVTPTPPPTFAFQP